MKTMKADDYEHAIVIEEWDYPVIRDLLDYTKQLEQKQRWVPVGERLPPSDGSVCDVLVKFVDEGCEIRHHSELENLYGVLYWMELPE